MGPKEIIGDKNIEKLVLEKNKLSVEPFKQSAKFTVYNDIIRIRANWTNTIKMKLE